MSGPIDWAFDFVWSRIFTFRPKVSKENDELVARSGWRTLVFTLGGWQRKVIVNPRERTIRIKNRAFWLFPSSKMILFDRVEEVLLAYGDVHSAASDSWVAHQQEDVFTVGLLLKTGEEVKLFRFHGSGDFSHDGTFPDWMYWDDYINEKITRTPQDGEALDYADLLSAMIGVPIGNPRP